MPDQTLKAALLMGCLVSASGAAAFERDRVYGPLPHHETYNPLIAYRHPQDRTTVGTRPPRHRAHYRKPSPTYYRSAS